MSILHPVPRRAGHELRGHLVRRDPTPREFATRHPLALTTRDIVLLVWIYRFGFLTAELLELAFFPAQRGQRSSPSSAGYERVRHLWLWDYLQRIEQPVSRLIGGRRPFLYALGKQAIPVVAHALGVSVRSVHLRRLDRISFTNIDHDLRAAAFWANVRTVVCARPFRERRWWTEGELRARHLHARDPETGRWLPILPDGCLDLEYANGRVQTVLVEVDTGTLTLGRFGRKVRAFELALQQDVFKRAFQRDWFEVVVLTDSPARLTSLREVAQEEVAQERWFEYTFATFEVLDPAMFPTAGWVDLNGDVWEGVLYDEDAEADQRP